MGSIREQMVALADSVTKQFFRKKRIVRQYTFDAAEDLIKGILRELDLDTWIPHLSWAQMDPQLVEDAADRPSGSDKYALSRMFRKMFELAPQRMHGWESPLEQRWGKVTDAVERIMQH